jgi:hypothetical protein
MEAVQNVESEYSNYDISSQGFITNVITEEQEIEKRIIEKELEDNDIGWLSEKLRSLNKEFSERIGIMLAPKNLEEKPSNEEEDMEFHDAYEIDS